jgi:hypothetical protein
MAQCRAFYMGVTIPANNRQKIAHNPAADCLRMGNKNPCANNRKGQK